MSQVSVVIPYMKSNENRDQVLLFILQQIVKTGLCHEVIVSEQIKPNEEPSFKCDMPEVIAVSFSRDSERFCRGACINFGVKQATGDFVMCHDGNVWLPFDQVIKEVKDCDQVVQPFVSLTEPTDKTTREFMSGKKINPVNKMHFVNFGTGSLIIRKDLFEQLRGFDERIEGWATADSEFEQRLALFHLPRCLEQIKGLFLYQVSDTVQDYKDELEHWPIVMRGHMAKYNPLEYLEQVQSPFPVPVHPPELIIDTAVILVLWGNKHRDLLENTLQCLGKQDCKHYLVVLEGLFDGEESIAADLLKSYDNAIHLTIPMAEKNRHLMQKEALMNKAVWEVVPRQCEHLIFLDSDTLVYDSTWLGYIRLALKQTWNTLVQVFERILDTQDKEYCWTSMGIKVVRNGFHFGAPGIGWGMNKKYFQAIGGWNPFHITGGGDTLFVWEVLPRDCLYQNPPPVFTNNQIRKGLPKARLEFAPFVLFHQYHGTRKSRAYVNRYIAVGRYSNSPDQFVKLGDDGLLEWLDLRHPLVRILARKSELLTQDDVERVCREEESKPIPHLITWKNFNDVLKEDIYYKGRWDHIGNCVSMLREIPFRNSLEIGSYKLPMNLNGTYMDIKEYLPGTIKHDATVVPWDFEDNEFDIVICLQVFEHLGNSQQDVFREIQRIGKKALLSFPYKWERGSDMHVGIDDETIDHWTCGVKPVRVKLIGEKYTPSHLRVAYYFEF